MSVTLKRQPPAADPGVSEMAREFRLQLSQRLHSLDENCLQSLVEGIDGAIKGDLTIEVKPVTTPIDMAVDDPALAGTREGVQLDAGQGAVGA